MRLVVLYVQVNLFRFSFFAVNNNAGATLSLTLNSPESVEVVGHSGDDKFRSWYDNGGRESKKRVILSDEYGRVKSVIEVKGPLNLQPRYLEVEVVELDLEPVVSTLLEVSGPAGDADVEVHVSQLVQVVQTVHLEKAKTLPRP